MTNVGKTALITGASSVIGSAFCEELDKVVYDLVLTARREDRINQTAVQLTEKYDIKARVFPADLSKANAPQELYDQIDQAGITIDVLVNNAGYTIPEYYMQNTWQIHSQFIQLMITSVCHLTHLFLDGMIKRKFGRIINVSSLGSFLPGTAGHTLYNGSKSLILKFSQSLSIELLGTGVNVSALCPGFTRTGFHDATGLKESSNKILSSLWMDANTVARQGIDAVEKAQVVCVTGIINKLIAVIIKCVPDSLVLWLAASGAGAHKGEDISSK
jgi:short-subunit dehydrogenase